MAHSILERISINSRNNFQRANFINLTIIVGLVIVYLITRIPFRSEILFNWDSVNYALGMQDFDVWQHRPHPPGYILYISLARLIDQIINNPNSTLVMISIIAGSLTVVFTYLYAVKRFNLSDAFFAALLMLTNPLLWFYDELALNYSLEAFFSISIGYSFFLAMKGSKTWAILGVILMGIGGGFRQTILIVFLPLVIFTFLHQTWKLRILGSALLVLICLSWAIPLINSMGGLNAFFAASKLLSSILERPTLLTLLHAFFYGGHILLILFLLALFGLIRLPANSFYVWEKNFLLLWIAPNLLVISLFHIGQSGYVLFFLPPLMIYSPFLIRTGLPQLEPFLFRKKDTANQDYDLKIRLLIGMLVLVNIASFFTGGYYSIRVHDHLWKTMRELVQKYPPSETIILTDTGRMNGFRMASYYFPEYHVYGISKNALDFSFFTQNGTFEFSKWFFHSYNRSDDYELSSNNSEFNVILEIPQNIKGLIVGDPSLWNRLLINHNNELVSIRGEPINDMLMYLVLPKDSAKLVVSLGALIVQP
jgi:hypothetical protein